MDIFGLAILISFEADVPAACLVIGIVGAGRNLFVDRRLTLPDTILFLIVVIRRPEDFKVIAFCSRESDIAGA